MSLEMKYFVLNPRSKSADDIFAQASRKAMQAYADHIESEDAFLARSLRLWAGAESDRELRLWGYIDNQAAAPDSF